MQVNGQYLPFYSTPKQSAAVLQPIV